MVENMQATYDAFVEKAAQGRNTTPERIDAIGQGRVWTGRQAKEIGLVDELGGLDRAVALAKQRAKIAQDTEVELVIYPPKKSIYDLLPRPARQQRPRLDAGVAARVRQPEGRAGARRAAAGLPPRRAAGAHAERICSVVFLKGGSRYAGASVRWTRPDASPFASASTSATDTRLKSPGIVCFSALAATAKRSASACGRPVTRP